MRLNHDHVRAVLLALEDHLLWSVAEYDKIKFIDKNPLSLRNGLCNLLPDIPVSEIAYISLRLKEAGFININLKYAVTDSTIANIEYYDITFQGHEYLDSVRDPAVWKEVKKKIEKFDSVPTGIITQVASAAFKLLLGL